VHRTPPGAMPDAARYAFPGDKNGTHRATFTVSSTCEADFRASLDAPGMEDAMLLLIYIILAAILGLGDYRARRAH